MTEDFLSHLEELRKRLLIAIGCFFSLAVLAYFFSGQLIDFLVAPLRRQQDAHLIFQTPYEAFLIHVKVAAVAGLLGSLPVLFWQFWIFVAPGLYDKEKKIFLPLIVVCSGLFLTGSAFAYYWVIPFGLNFLLSFQTESLRPFIGIAPYFSFLLGMLLAFGLLFDFPVVMLGLIRLGVLRAEAVAKARRIVVVLIFIAAAILTPSPDPVSQLLLALPLIVLFEISLVIARTTENKGKMPLKD